MHLGNYNKAIMIAKHSNSEIPEDESKEHLVFISFWWLMLWSGGISLGDGAMWQIWYYLKSLAISKLTELKLYIFLRPIMSWCWVWNWDLHCFKRRHMINPTVDNTEPDGKDCHGSRFSRRAAIGNVANHSENNDSYFLLMKRQHVMTGLFLIWPCWQAGDLESP